MNWYCVILSCFSMLHLDKRRICKLYILQRKNTSSENLVIFERCSFKWVQFFIWVLSAWVKTIAETCLNFSFRQCLWINWFTFHVYKYFIRSEFGLGVCDILFWKKKKDSLDGLNNLFFLSHYSKIQPRHSIIKIK